MCKGTVKYFNDNRGWGIIESDETQQDVYVHHTGITMDGFRTLAEGQEVQYELIQTDQGPRANNVKPSI